MKRLRSGAGELSGAGPVLVVSPHLDDGVMSCGCLIAVLSRRRPVTVATVFAGRPPLPAHEPSQWDRAAGFSSGDDVVGARRREDRAALRVLQARPRWLPFRDSQYGRSPAVSAVARHLAHLPALRSPDATVLFPLGLFHSDHRLAREAALALLRGRSRCAVWLAYEDALYRRLPGLRDAALARLRRAGFAPRRLHLAADADSKRRKARAVACYASQLRALATPGRLGHGDAIAAESYWLVGERLAGERRAGERRAGECRASERRAAGVLAALRVPRRTRTIRRPPPPLPPRSKHPTSPAGSTVRVHANFAPGAKPRVAGGRRRGGKGGGGRFLPLSAGGHAAATTPRRPRRLSAKVCEL